MRRRLSWQALLTILALTASLVLAACQSVPPPASDDKAMTVGDWTVRQGGYVRVETGVVK